MKQCPCHSGLLYSSCCQPLHQGKPAPNALALMRSRYSAYALNLPKYIIQTTHPNNPSYQENLSKWTKELEQFSAHTKFTGLEILNFTPEDKEAFVTFHAQLRQNGKDASFIEKSRFIKEKHQWYYLCGIVSR